MSEAEKHIQPSAGISPLEKKLHPILRWGLTWIFVAFSGLLIWSFNYKISPTLNVNAVVENPADTSGSGPAVAHLFLTRYELERIDTTRTVKIEVEARGLSAPMQVAGRVIKVNRTPQYERYAVTVLPDTAFSEPLRALPLGTLGKAEIRVKPQSLLLWMIDVVTSDPNE